MYPTCISRHWPLLLQQADPRQLPPTIQQLGISFRHLSSILTIPSTVIALVKQPSSRTIMRNQATQVTKPLHTKFDGEYMWMFPFIPMPPFPFGPAVFMENGGKDVPIGVVANPVEGGMWPGMPGVPPMGTPVPLIPFSDQCQKLSKSIMVFSLSASAASGTVGPGVGSGR